LYEDAGNSPGDQAQPNQFSINREVSENTSVLRWSQSLLAAEGFFGTLVNFSSL
jgi:hypothetical protein